METIKKSELRKIVKELFSVKATGQPFADVVTVNDVVDDTLKDFCHQVSKNNCTEDDSKPEKTEDQDGLYYENIVRKLIRKLIESEKK